MLNLYSPRTSEQLDNSRAAIAKMQQERVSALQYQQYQGLLLQNQQGLLQNQQGLLQQSYGIIQQQLQHYILGQPYQSEPVKPKEIDYLAITREVSGR